MDKKNTAQIVGKKIKLTELLLKVLFKKFLMVLFLGIRNFGQLLFLF
jgi:hypothetical protein